MLGGGSYPNRLKMAFVTPKTASQGRANSGMLIKNMVMLPSGSQPGRQEINDISMASPNRIQPTKRPRAGHTAPREKAHAIGNTKRVIVNGTVAVSMGTWCKLNDRLGGGCDPRQSNLVFEAPHKVRLRHESAESTNRMLLHRSNAASQTPQQTIYEVTQTGSCSEQTCLCALMLVQEVQCQRTLRPAYHADPDPS